MAGEEFTIDASDLERNPELIAEFLKVEDPELALGTGVPLGDVFFAVRSPFEIDPDPFANRIEDCRFIQEDVTRPRSYFEDRYGKEVEETADHSLSQNYLDWISSFTAPHEAQTRESQNRDPDESCVEHTLWVKPCRQAPRWMYYVVAGNEVIDKGELETSRIPIVHLQEITTPGRFWGSCALGDMVHLQQEYNRARLAARREPPT